VASRRSRAQAATSNGPSVEETGTVKWFNAERATVSSLRMAAGRMFCPRLGS
jgi:hypothetical protein